MNRLSDEAINIINDLHTERLDYNSEYLPLIDAAQRLAHYEDLEESGRLVVLPCKVGDTVWFRTYSKNATVDLGIQPHEVSAVRAYMIVPGEFAQVGLPVDHFGRTVFLSREEAEKALEAMK